MVNKKTIVIITLILSINLLYFLYNTPGKKIKKRLKKLTELVSKKAGRTSGTTFYKLNKLQSLFDRRCTLEMSEEFICGDYSPGELSQLALKFHNRADTINLSFYDLEITLLPDKQATAHFTARLTASNKNGEKEQSVKEIIASLRETKGKWLFYKFSEVEVLEK